MYMRMFFLSFGGGYGGMLNINCNLFVVRIGLGVSFVYRYTMYGMRLSLRFDVMYPVRIVSSAADSGVATVNNPVSVYACTLDNGTAILSTKVASTPTAIVITIGNDTIGIDMCILNRL